MKTRFFHLVLFLSLPLALAVLVVIRRMSGYQGKPAIVWFEEMRVPRNLDTDPDPAGILALRHIGKRALPTVQRALLSGPRWERTKAAWTLGRLGPVATNSIPSLIKALDDSDPTVRFLAIRSLTQVDAADDRLGPKLVAALADTNPAPCAAAGELLRHIEQERIGQKLPPIWTNEIEYAMAFAQSPAVRNRLLGIDRLAALPERNEEVTAALRSLLSDPVEVVRRRTARKGSVLDIDT